MGGPRNNLTWHPPEVRYRVYALHYEGLSAAQINADPVVAASVAKTGYRLHNNTLAAAWRSAEYKRGGTRFGGRPDVPRGFEWPAYEGEGMHQVEIRKNGSETVCRSKLVFEPNR